MLIGIFYSQIVESSPLVSVLFTPHAQRERGKVIGCGVHMFVNEKIFESYFRDRLTFSNIRSRTSRRIYRLALPLRTAETLSSLSKLTWNLPWNGASPFADQTSRMQNWKEMNVWSSTVYSCDFHESRQHFITLLMFVLNFV